MVTQIASDVGVDASELLTGEIDSLNKRLEYVRESISTLADIAESCAINEEECTKNINQAKSYFNNMQQVRQLFFFTLFYSIKWLNFDKNHLYDKLCFQVF